MSTHLPAETLKISPEALEIANCYLQVQDARQVAGRGRWQFKYVRVALHGADLWAF